MSITKIIELLSIETINDNSYLKIKVTTVDEQIFFWQVDEDTANSLREICKFEDPYRFRLSMQTTFDKREHQFVSHVTKTYRDQSERINFYCSKQYHIQLERIKLCQKIEDFNTLSFLFENIPAHEFIESEIDETPGDSLEDVEEIIEDSEEIQPVENTEEVIKVEEILSPSPEQTLPEKEDLQKEIEHSTEQIENKTISVVNEEKVHKDKSEKKVSQSKNRQKKQSQKWITASLISAILLIIIIIFFDVFNNETNKNEDSNSKHETLNQPNQTNVEVQEPTDLLEDSVKEVPVLHIEDPIAFNIPEGYVAITINEGPSKYTKKIVDILRQHEVGGTFFFIGYNVQKHPDVVEYVHSYGYPIGSLSMTHNIMTEQTFAEQQYEIKQSIKMIEHIIQDEVSFFRPPYGLFDENTQKVVTELQSQMVLWNIDPRDWKIQNPPEIIEHIRKTKTSGSIIVLHESQQLVDMLPAIIEVLKEQNLKIVSLN